MGEIVCKRRMSYTRFLNMVDKNYKYENDEFIAYIQDIQDLGTFLELFEEFY